MAPHRRLVVESLERRELLSAQPPMPPQPALPAVVVQSFELVRDLNGDGRTDVVLLTVNSDKGVGITTLLNQGRGQLWRTGSQQLVSGPTTLAFPPTLDDPTRGTPTPADLDGDGIVMPDLDGDGRDDLLFVRNGPRRGTMTIVTGFQTTRFFWSTSTFATARQPPGTRQLVGDVNGDRLEDIVFLTTNANGVRATTLFSQGYGQPRRTAVQQLRSGPTTLAFDSNANPALVDLDGDGTRDLLFLENGPAGTITVVTAFQTTRQSWTTFTQVISPAQTLISSTTTGELSSSRPAGDKGLDVLQLLRPAVTVGSERLVTPSYGDGFKSGLVTELHRYDEGRMFGGWGQHLGHLLRSSDNTLWFADDTGNDVNWNPAVAYYRLEGDSWFLKGTNDLIGHVQQNTASIMVLDTIYSYGVDIVGRRIVESYYDTDSGVGNSSYLPFVLAPASNYIGAAVSPSGARIVWWTQVTDGRGKFHYTYNTGSGWRRVISSSVNGYHGAAYVTIAFKDNSNFTLQAELIRGQPQDWTFRSAVADGRLGKPISRWVLLPGKRPNNTMSPNDIWINPVSKDSHALTYTYNNDTAYYYRRKNGSWTGPLYTFPAVYRARFIASDDGNLYMVYGKSGEGLKIVAVSEREIEGRPINWRKLPVKPIPTLDGYDDIYAIYPESSAYQNNPVRGINFAAVGSQRQNEVLHVGEE